MVNNFQVAPNWPAPGDSGILKLLSVRATDILIARFVTTGLRALPDTEEAAYCLVRDVVRGLTETKAEMEQEGHCEPAIDDVLAVLRYNPAHAHDFARAMTWNRVYAAMREGMPS